jgi:hypothetical protein
MNLLMTATPLAMSFCSRCVRCGVRHRVARRWDVCAGVLHGSRYILRRAK